VNRTVFIEGRYRCTVQYVEKGGTGVPYSISRGVVLVYRTINIEGGTGVPYSIYRGRYWSTLQYL
jgi:hypothetical protein